MKPNLNIDASAVLVIGGVLAVGVLAYKLWPSSKTLSAVGDALNPASDKNLAYRGVNAAGSFLTGDADYTLGGAIYDLFNPDPMAQMATQAQKDNPRSPYYQPKYANTSNPFYSGANYLGTALTGDGDFTVGGWVYDLFNPDPMKQPYHSTTVEAARAKPAPIKSGGGGQFNGHGTSGSW